MIEENPPKQWTIAVDKRDVLAGVGGVCVLVGAAAFHWALALIVTGLGLSALAYRLSR